jgi:short subunit dehydrogenase-like uncharacterized protein
MKTKAEFDIIVFGATGFTGRLVAEYLSTRHGSNGQARWAMAGRNPEKLARVHDQIRAWPGTPILGADAADPGSLKSMAERAKVVLSTVGPYQLYGSPLVAVCADTGTDYVDLCGELAWMRSMIDAHESASKRSGARIVFSCGFDSIPFVLGVWFLQQEAKARFGFTVPRVKCRVRGTRGSLSGGTLASLKATLAAAARDPSVLNLLMNPFALTPGFTGPKQPQTREPAYDEDLGAWTAPFIMAPINICNVHRSNFLMGHPYGRDFVYDESMVAGTGENGRTAANAIVGANASIMASTARKPGEGPGKAERDAGFYDLLFIGIAPDGREIRASVRGDEDPGYGSTSRMIAEAALCLIQTPHLPGGVWASGTGMQKPLIDQLRQEAGLVFNTE